MSNAYSSLGTILEVEVATVMTEIAGIRNVNFNPGEVEMFESDDLVDTHVNQSVTGRTGGGEVTAQMFTDFLAATWTPLADLWMTPAVNNYRVTWPNADSDGGTAGVQAATQPFVGILKTIPVVAERGQPLLSDISISVARKPVLVNSTPLP